MAVTVVEFTGTIGQPVPVGDGVNSVQGTPLFAAAEHGTGVGITQTDYVELASPSGVDWAGSIYITVGAIPSSGASRGVVIRADTQAWLSCIRLHTTRGWEVTTGTTLDHTFGFAAAVDETYRIDWLVKTATETIDWRITAKSDELTTYSYSVAWPASSVLGSDITVGAGGAPADTDLVADTFRYEAGGDWLPPYQQGEQPVAVSVWNGSSEETATITVWDGAAEQPVGSVGVSG